MSKALPYPEKKFVFWLNKANSPSLRGYRRSIRWLKVSNKDTNDFIFTSVRGGSVPITAVHFRRIIKSWCDECGWDEKFFSSHSIRKSLPTELYKQTKDLRSCQILLGHQSIGNTAHYLGINEESAFDLIRKHRIWFIFHLIDRPCPWSNKTRSVSP